MRKRSSQDIYTPKYHFPVHDTRLGGIPFLYICIFCFPVTVWIFGTPITPFTHGNDPRLILSLPFNYCTVTWSSRGSLLTRKAPSMNYPVLFGTNSCRLARLFVDSDSKSYLHHIVSGRSSLQHFPFRSLTSRHCYCIQ